MATAAPIAAASPYVSGRTPPKLLLPTPQNSPLHFSRGDSAIRHLAKYLMGWDDEPHLRAAAWNVLFAIYMEQKHPEMQDITARKKEGEHGETENGGRTDGVV